MKLLLLLGFSTSDCFVVAVAAAKVAKQACATLSAGRGGLGSGNALE
jgi:hypothetical protein